MSEIVAMGRRHFVGVFAAAGAAAVPCQTPQALAEETAKLLKGRRPALVVLDQHFAACDDSIAALRKRGTVVVLLPAERQEGHPALDDISSLIEVAAGANILGEY